MSDETNESSHKGKKKDNTLPNPRVSLICSFIFHFTCTLQSQTQRFSYGQRSGSPRTVSKWVRGMKYKMNFVLYPSNI